MEIENPVGNNPFYNPVLDSLKLMYNFILNFQSILEDEKLRMTKREITKDFASFNLAAAKATKEKRKDEDVYKLPHVSQ